MIYSILLYLGIATFAGKCMEYGVRQNKISNKRRVFLILCFLMGVFAAFRGLAGTDSITYITIYNEPDRYFTRTDIEIGYKIIMWICHSISADYKLLFGVTGFLTAFFTIKLFEKNSDNIDLFSAMFCFVILQFILYFNIMRQGLAIAIMLYAIELYLEKKNISAYLLLLLATSIHMFAFLGFGIILIKKLIESKYYKQIIFCIVLVAVYFLRNIEKIKDIFIALSRISIFSVLSSYRYMSYLNSTHVMSFEVLIKNIVLMLPLIAIISFILVEKNIDRKYVVYYTIYIGGTIISLLGVITGTQVQRIGYYFLFIESVLFGYVAKNGGRLLGKRISSFSMKFLIVLIIIVLFIIERVINNYAELIPYGRTMILYNY